MTFYDMTASILFMMNWSSLKISEYDIKLEQSYLVLFHKRSSLNWPKGFDRYSSEMVPNAKPPDPLAIIYRISSKGVFKIIRREFWSYVRYRWTRIVAINDWSSFKTKKSR